MRRLQATAASGIPLPSPGEMVGTFRLEEAIGAGGMGAVYRAMDTQLDRQVALKLLPPDQAADPEVVLRFYQEGKSAAQLDHENIARVYSIGHDGPLHHIAFEYIEGVNLRHRVEGSGPLEPAEAVDVSLQIAGALVHASRRGVVHRDIKPSNIILTPQGRAKVVDMGLARRFERGGDHGLTQSGMTLGTFDYISPEQARDPRDVDVRSDLYSLGCTMFHMLTGRPPFPGGTVLQKLIQHQEEAPADVRTLNPGVPAALSAIITKLMAKERDRRYQSPEHLVRDLMATAGAMGIERAPTELEGWMLRPHHAWWERHLAWALPAIGFVVVVSGLAWWGREFSRPAAPTRGTSAGTVAGTVADLKIAAAPAPEIRPVEAGATLAGAGSVPVAEYPRTIPVGPADSLEDVLASAPRGSEIVLSDAGPYLVSGRPPSAVGSKRPAGAGIDLTIRAEAGVRPILRAAGRDGSGAATSDALLRFVDGHVTIERVEFQLDAPPEGGTACAIRSEDTELTLRGCSFRRPDRDDEDATDAELVAIVARSSRTTGSGSDRTPAIFADACYFDGELTAVRAQGPADVTLRDCTLGPASPSFRFDSARPDRATPGDLRLIHTSILAGVGPVFRFDGPVRARVDDSVIAKAGAGDATLVQVDDPRNLSWRGRSNVYGSIGPFLTTSSRSSRSSIVPDLVSWEQGAAEPRELGSRSTNGPVWDAAEPIAALEQNPENPTRAFRLDPKAGSAAGVGARRGPYGPMLNQIRLSQRSAPARSSPSTIELEVPATRPAAAPERPATVAVVVPAPTAAEPRELPAMPPTANAVTPTTAPETDPEGFGQPMPMPMPMPTPPPSEPILDTTRREVKKVPVSASRPAQDSALSTVGAIRDAEGLLSALRRLEERGGTIRIAAGADLDLPSLAILAPTSKRIRIAAESGGGVRPRLRFQPSAAVGISPADWLALVTLRSGSLSLEGLDLIVPEPEGVAAERLAAIAVLPGTELILDDCTVTVAARGAVTTAMVVQPAPGETGARSRDGAALSDAVIAIRDGFLRSGGDAVIVAGGGRLSMTLEDSMVATEGSLLHAMGAARDAGNSTGKAEVRVRIDRVSARAKGGLVHLQTARDEPHMAAVQFDADRSIISTGSGDHPLFRLEGQDQVERLRDKIRWVGRGIAYHRIKTYRRDEIVQAGGLPKIYDRDDWTRAFEPTDDAPILADLAFQRPVDATVPAWRVVRDDLRLAVNGAVGPLGPDAGKVPEPPPPDEEF